MQPTASTGIAPHASWLKPFLDIRGGTIKLLHNSQASRLEQITTEGLKIPERLEDMNWGSDVKAVFAYVPSERSLTLNGDLCVQFEYPISKVRVRPPLISHEPDRYGVSRQGILLSEYLLREPPKVWNLVTAVEFLILENVGAQWIKNADAK